MSEDEKNSSTFIYGDLRLKTFPVPIRIFNPSFPLRTKRSGRK